MKNIVLLMAFIAMTGFVSAAEVLYNESPIEDTFVDSQDSSSNDGDSSLMIQGSYGDDDDFDSIQRSLLMFDVSSIPDGAVITSALFGIYLDEIAPNNSWSSYWSTPEAELLFIADDTWAGSVVGDDNTDADFDFTEAALSNPSTSSFGIDDLSSTGYIEWDLLAASGISYYNVDNSDGLMSFMLMSTDENINNGAGLLSNNSQINQPYLKITYSVVPAPGSITLAVVGLSSLMAIRRKKRNL